MEFCERKTKIQNIAYYVNLLLRNVSELQTLDARYTLIEGGGRQLEKRGRV